MWGPETACICESLGSSEFLGFLTTLTGISDLSIDFWGGGLHQTVSGGLLSIHADFNRHPCTGLDRRLNLLLFLNRDWDEAWGGALELWDVEMTGCVQRIWPVANRMVVFSTSDTSFHGHPDPLAVPPEITRKSIAAYYYTAGRPKDEQSDEHSTIYRTRPGGDW
jgi:Rps23 Pro-64 3,4-dihydroxylase Tpa1-like proline 4-hydroxylase